jgi:hypothetical protein
MAEPFRLQLGGPPTKDAGHSVEIERRREASNAAPHGRCRTGWHCQGSHRGAQTTTRADEAARNAMHGVVVTSHPGSDQHHHTKPCAAVQPPHHRPRHSRSATKGCYGNHMPGLEANPVRNSESEQPPFRTTTGWDCDVAALTGSRGRVGVMGPSREGAPQGRRRQRLNSAHEWCAGQASRPLPRELQRRRGR